MAKEAVKEIKYTVSDLHRSFDKQYDKLKKNISGYIKNPDFSLLDRSYDYAIEKHIKQVRRSGDPYFDHLFNVAVLLTELKLDITTISCGFLHDVLEDTDVTIDEFSDVFGKEVTDLVNGVTKITSLSANSQKLKQAENFRKMILSSANDLRVLLIKFADRLHNMRTLNHMPSEKRTRIATETKDVYAPLAHRFGLQKVKIELEDLSLKYLDSESYFFLKRKIEETQEQRNDYIGLTIKPIEKELKSSNVKSMIYGRPKHFYSIYNKMMKRQKPFEEIYDLLAIRIIVDKIEECYFALGIVHSLYIPVADRFKDYIATPKINGYQSLHTTIIGPNGQMVEIQIRSEEMHVHAEEGIAAHWRYKDVDLTKKKTSSSSDDALTQHIQWLKQFIDRQDETDSEDFLDNLKIDLFQDEVFVYTPMGDLFTLPKGSTPIDFAFHIHSNLGLQCSGAKVNGQIKPLKTELKSGDVVQIISSKTQHPKKEWLSIVKTSKARHYIKKWIKQNEMEQFKSIGEQIITDITKRLEIKAADVDYEKLMSHYNFKHYDTLMAAIGRSQISLNSLEYQLKPHEKQEKKRGKAVKEAEDSSNNIFGIDNIMISYGKCCNPIPGDIINGYVTAGRGITIHRMNCKNTEKLKEQHPERFIFLNWNYLSNQSEKYQVKILISATNRNFLVRDISQALSKVDIGISAIDIKTDQNDLAYGFINVFVDGNDTLNNVMNIIRNISSVVHVERDELSSGED